MRVVFLGTPEFATLPLRALAADRRYELVGVITQPDRPAGRGTTLQSPPVRQVADQLGIPVLQPETLKDPEAIAWLAACRPDVGVVAAYGEILRKQVLALPPLGYINIHPSLLPLHRGPTPVSGAILAGEAETGVSVMLLSAKMDAGPILIQHRQPLRPNDYAGPLTTELFQIGSQLLVEVLEPYAAGTIIPQPQDDSQATYTRLLSKTDGQIDWTQAASSIERMIRAYDPWPGAISRWQGQPFRILAAEPLDHPAVDQPPGTVVDLPTGLAVATGAGWLHLITVQPAGKRALAATDWRRGIRSLNDTRLGG